MKFHLNYIPAKPGFEINHDTKLLLTGSCFSENIGALLYDHHFKIKTNPSGILFNPLSIHTTLNDALELNAYNENHILPRGNSFLSYQHHSSINNVTKNELLHAIHSENENMHHFLKEAGCLVITFGSAYYYHHKELNIAVANCHKQAANVFEKRLLNVAEITDQYTALIKKLQAFNPALKIIFTVSPVKHLRDGVVENNLSKSTLALSIYQLVNQFDNCYYFPAYELVTDDLRDYRFYKADLAHPNELAIQYVWEKFSDCFFSSKTIDLNAKILKLNSAKKHRPLHRNSDENDKLEAFISKQKEEIFQINPRIDI